MRIKKVDIQYWCSKLGISKEKKFTDTVWLNCPTCQLDLESLVHRIVKRIYRDSDPYYFELIDQFAHAGDSFELLFCITEWGAKIEDSNTRAVLVFPRKRTKFDFGRIRTVELMISEMIANETPDTDEEGL